MSGAEDFQHSAVLFVFLARLLLTGHLFSLLYFAVKALKFFLRILLATGVCTALNAALIMECIHHAKYTFNV